MTSTVERLTTAPDPVDPSWRSGRPVAWARRWWRVLTSMRTALILLFLLALAAVPGSLLPQRSLNQAAVSAYFAEQPDLAPILDRLGMFDVFAAPWFAAIYLLLFISLIGCLSSRVPWHVRALRAPPPAAPARLERLPESADRTVTGVPAEVAVDAEAMLRRGRWRVLRRERGGVVELSAEKGYLRETGNLAFHLSLVALLAGLAAGKLFGYEGSVLVQEGAGFCNSFQQYDTYRNGPFADAGDLTPLCVDLERFGVEYEPDLTPALFTADINYSRELGGSESAYPLEVNSPLRTDGVRLYLTGHGFAPRFTVTYPDGSLLEDVSAPFLPEDPGTLASSGAVKLPDRPNPGPDDDQLAIEGFFVPTAAADDAAILTSIDPRPRNPAVAIVAYAGSIGIDSGRPQNVYTLDQRQIERGALERVAAGNLFVGETLTLPDGTQIRFEGYRQWAALQLSHDPGQLTVLAAAVVMLVGLLGSLLVGRRRVWLRISAAPADDARGAPRTVIAAGGLAKTDGGGFGTEFADLITSLDTLRGRKD
ncbi:cytochrome c biogenesis protein ResB [soil metagenome]